jgi:dihydrofolate reductase
VTAPRVTLIVAATERDVIGDSNDLPWYLPADLRRFRRLTTGHTVVVGRLTQESIVRRLGTPLPDRRTVVVTSRDSAGLPSAATVPAALDLARDLAQAGGGEVFVIGGAQVYSAALPFVDRVELTRVHADIPGDTALPDGWLAGFTLTSSEPGPAGSEPAFTWLTYERS